MIFTILLKLLPSMKKSESFCLTLSYFISDLSEMFLPFHLMAGASAKLFKISQLSPIRIWFKDGIVEFHMINVGWFQPRNIPFRPFTNVVKAEGITPGDEQENHQHQHCDH